MNRGSALRRAATGLVTGAVGIAVVTAVIAALDDLVRPDSFASLYLFAILPVAILSGFWIAGIIAIASFLTFAFFFAAPLHSFAIAEADTATTLVAAIVAAYVVSALARRFQLRAREARLRAREAEEARSALRRSAEEQAALRRVATLVARRVSPTEIFETVTREVALLCDADVARLERYEEDGTVTGIAGWSRGEEGHLAVGTRIVLQGISIAALVKETGRPMRIDSFAEAAGPIAQEARSLGIRSSVGCPVIVGGATWGVIAASSMREAAFPPSAEVQIGEFTELVATAIANAEARAELRRIGDEQAALRRVATLVARGAAPADVLQAVTREVRSVFAADRTAIVRLESDGEATVVSQIGILFDKMPVGSRRRVERPLAVAQVFETGQSARVDDFSDATGGFGEVVRNAGVGSSVAGPIVVEGRLWGAIVIGSESERFPADTERRMVDFTELVATAIANAQAQAELTASRARVVASADETRRRIERDLHDGAQQRLVSLALQLRAAQAAVPPDLDELEAELDHVASELRGAMDELREYARGIHPAILAEGGLEPALKTLGRRSPVPVELNVRMGGRLPEAVEVGAYYVVSEALANVAKHAQASSVGVQVELGEGVLHVRVRDDGVGGADFSGGSGLVGLKDRVEALGGRIALQSESGRGTTLAAELPLVGDGARIDPG